LGKGAADGWGPPKAAAAFQTASAVGAAWGAGEPAGGGWAATGPKRGGGCAPGWAAPAGPPRPAGLKGRRGEEREKEMFFLF
jgi:hypothetical protein